MTKWVILVAMVVMFATSSFAASLALKATFTPNTEEDMMEYRLYRTDITRTLVGTIPHPPVLPYLFNVTVPDNSKGTLMFVLTAVDTSNNESLDSLPASYSYNIDALPPVAPSMLSVQPQ